MTEGAAPARPVDRRHYESSGYFEAGGDRLLDHRSAFQRYRTREVLRLAGPLADHRVVDLGCGWGTISFAAAREAEFVVGVDFAGPSLGLCRRRWAREPLPNLRFVQADAARTPLGGASWDLVVLADLVEHLYPNDTLGVYQEALRLLRPGGRLLVWTPNPGHLLERLRFLGILTPDPTHVDYKDLPRVVRELEGVGFRIESAGYVASHLPGLRTLERWTQKWVPILRRRVAVVASKS